MKHVIVIITGLIIWVITVQWIIITKPYLFWPCVIMSFIFGWYQDDVHNWLKRNWP